MTPLTHVTTHIVDAQLVRLFLSDRLHLTFAILRIPCHFMDIIGTSKLGFGGKLSATSGILPLCLGRETEVLLGEFVEFGNEALAVFP